MKTGEVVAFVRLSFKGRPCTLLEALFAVGKQSSGQERERARDDECDGRKRERL